MILTVSDFLEEFKNFALAKIENDDSDVKHRPTIGNIFEGLTSELLDKAIFEDLDLRIVQKSFIYNDSEAISSEMDCMLVVGSGLKISFTNQYKYHVKDVIAIFQVKKNLYANDIDDSHQNLRSVINVSEPREAEPFVGKLHRGAYKLLTSKEIPSEERRKRFTDRENIVYHLLMMDAFHPLRIVIGYYGYTSEFGLREGFVTKLESILEGGPTKGYSPVSFPNLYICGNSTIIKCNGMPMGIPFKDEEFYWHLLVSSTGKPMYHLLQLIWTRLSFKFGLGSQIFGDDFDLESIHPFLSCKETKIGSENWGWEFFYHELNKEKLSRPMTPIPWEPCQISMSKYLILLMLVEEGVIDIKNNNRFNNFLSSEKLEPSKIIKELEEARLVFVDEGKMGLLVDELMMVLGSDNIIYAGENKSGEMANFISKQGK
jgi:hypothetical protein